MPLPEILIRSNSVYIKIFSETFKKNYIEKYDESLRLKAEKEFENKRIGKIQKPIKRF